MAFSLLAHTVAAGGATASVTTSGIDTTGANLIVACVTGEGTLSLSDNKSNTWTPLTQQAAGVVVSRLFYSVAPTVGSGHTFTAGATSNFPAVAVQAWSGVNVASAFDQQNGSANAAGSGVTTIQPGSITPVANGELIVFGVGLASAKTLSSANSGFTVSDTLANGLGVGFSYFTQSTAAAINPTGTFSGDAGLATANVASFKAGVVNTQTLTATQAQAATLTKSASHLKALSATQGQTATIATQRTKLKTLSATQASIATVQRLISKVLRAVQAQVASLSTTIVFVNPAYTYISVNGIARAYGRSTSTAQLMASSLKIADTVNDTPTRCTFAARGWAPTVGNDVVIALGSISNPDRMFGGCVLDVKPSYIGTPANAQYDVQAIDYTWLMDQEPFFGLFQSQTVATIAAALIAAAPGFTLNVKADIASLVIPEISFTNQNVTACFTQLVDRVGGYWYCDYFKVVQVFLDNAANNPTPLDGSYPLSLGLQNFRSSSALDQVITRQDSEGGGGNALIGAALGETILPVDDATFYNAAGGLVTIKQQRGVIYTGKINGGGGSLVGPGASPSAAPAVALASGTGLGVGVYQYAYTDVTASGESLPSPIATVTTGVTAAPSSAPTVGSPVGGVGADVGSHDYEVTFVTSAGETTPSAISGTATTRDVPNPAGSSGTVSSVSPSGVVLASGWHNGDSVYCAVTFVNAAGETLAATVSNTFVATYFGTGLATNANGIILSSIPVSADASVTNRRVYFNVNGSWIGYNDVGDSASTFQSFAGVVSAGSPPGANTAFVRTIPLTNIPVGSALVTSRKLYRRFNGSGTFKLVTTIANNTAATYSDTAANASLGAAAPSSNTATAQQVSVSGIGIGASPTTSRKVYRTAVGASQLKLLTTLADNTTTTLADSTADGSLGANAPTSDTSALTQPIGQILAGASTLLVAGAGAFSSGGGWAIIGNGQQIIRFTGVTGNTLTGIPTSGVGAITATVSYNSTVTAAACLTGIPAIGPGSLVNAIVAGDPVNLLVRVDDLAAQATLAALLSVSLPGSTGIKSSYVTDGRISETEARARAVARLALSRQVDTTIWYDCRDVLSRSGRTISVNLPTAPGGGVVGDFTIQRVDISLFSATAGNVSPLYPTYSVEASTRRFSLEDLLRRALAAAA